MSKSTPAERARKCFALAASTEHAGERDAAIARGMAIVEKNNLNPNHFEIPGRAKPTQRAAGSGFAGFATGGSFQFGSEALRAAVDAMQADFARAAARAARRDEELRRARETRRSLPELAASRLNDIGWRTKRAPSGRWSVTVGRVEFRDIPDDELIRIAAEKLDEEARRDFDHVHYEYDPSYRPRWRV